jgi:hypothetical protein
LIVGRDAPVVESSLWQGVRRSVYGIAAAGVEAASGGHREQGEKGQRSDDPRERIRS